MAALPAPCLLFHLNKVLISDIDNTLTGDSDALQKVLRILEHKREEVGFGLATGRPIDSALNFLSEHNIPAPDILITSVGTEIYYGGQTIQDSGWGSHIRQKWNKDKILSLLVELKFLKPQKSDFQREFKISFLMDPDPSYLIEINELLTKNKCQYSLVYSHQSYLDILPRRASKGKAIRYLSYIWGIPLENFLVCGDSGNDEEMLKGDPKGVVVGNYSKELERVRGKHGIYFSKKKYAAGIIDGIKHYRFLEV